MSNDKTSDVIEAAINSVLDQDDDYEEGDMVIEWVAIAYVTNPSKNDGTSAYPMWYSNGTMPTHTARGLYLTGLKFLDNVTETET